MSGDYSETDDVAAALRLEELQEDKKRLDWIASHVGFNTPFVIYLTDNGPDADDKAFIVCVYSYTGNNPPEYVGDSLREAIDAAIKRTQ